MSSDTEVERRLEGDPGRLSVDQRLADAVLRAGSEEEAVAGRRAVAGAPALRDPWLWEARRPPQVVAFRPRRRRCRSVQDCTARRGLEVSRQGREADMRTGRGVAGAYGTSFLRMMWDTVRLDGHEGIWTDTEPHLLGGAGGGEGGGEAVPKPKGVGSVSVGKEGVPSSDWLRAGEVEDTRMGSAQ